jgi:hypothetical protein
MKHLLQLFIAMLLCIGNWSSAKAQTNKEAFVPEWAKEVVWYQIFPERFRNGDPTNDPTVQDIKGADPQEAPKEWNIHPCACVR